MAAKKKSARKTRKKPQLPKEMWIAYDRQGEPVFVTAHEDDCRRYAKRHKLAVKGYGPQSKEKKAPYVIGMSTTRLEAYAIRNGQLPYLIIRDLASGRAEPRYHVFVTSSEDPVRIGCELPMDVALGLIPDYETEAAALEDSDGMGYIGQRNFALTVRNTVSALRAKQAKGPKAAAEIREQKRKDAIRKQFPVKRRYKYEDR